MHLEVGGDGGKRYWDVWIGHEVYVGVANVDINNIYERPSQYLLFFPSESTGTCGMPLE